MNIIRGHFNGTGADVYVCLGSVPKRVICYNLESATVETIEWDVSMIHDTLTCEGLSRPKAGGAVLDHANGEGISMYYGGVSLTSALQTSVTYGEGVYLEADDKDYRLFTNSSAGIVGDAENEDITTWTLDTSGSQTGHFNDDVVGTYIGEGSTVIIESNTTHILYEAGITVLAAAAGSADDAVTLTYDVPSGKVRAIKGKYGFKPMAVNSVSKAGFKLSNTTINANDGMVAFVAFCD